MVCCGNDTGHHLPFCILKTSSERLDYWCVHEGQPSYKLRMDDEGSGISFSVRLRERHAVEYHYLDTRV